MVQYETNGLWGKPFHIMAFCVPVHKIAIFFLSVTLPQPIETEAIVASIGLLPLACGRRIHFGYAYPM